MALGRGVRVQTGAALVAVRAGGLLLWDTVERAGETESGGHGAARNAGWRAGAWDEQTHEQTQRDEQSHKTKHEQSLGRDKLWGSGRAREGGIIRCAIKGGSLIQCAVKSTRGICTEGPEGGPSVYPVPQCH